MFVSIIINNYNYGRFICSAICSALEQSYPSFEVIVVDDGSTDDSRERIREFEGRIRTIFKPNGGQASAFNAGCRISRGSIIIFLDSDDILKPAAVSSIVAHWSNAFSKIHYPLDVIDNDGTPTGQIYPEKALSSGQLIERLLARGSYHTAPTSGNAFCRRFLEEVMPIPEDDWQSHADCYLIHLAPFYGEIGVVNDSLGYYRVHTSSLSLSGLVADGRVNANRLRNQLLRDIRQQILIFNYSTLLGYKAKPEPLTDQYSHYKIRLASLKSCPEQHPFQKDQLSTVAIGFIRRVWSDKDLRLSKRILLSLWALATLLVPRPLCESLVAQAIESSSRKKSVQLMARATA